jgi:hypothetical protein
MKHFLTAATMGLALAGSFAVSTAAEARSRSRSVSVQGAYGHGYNRSRAVTRQPGSSAVNRSIQTNDGRGVSSSRGANWGNGSYSGGATHMTSNGTSWGRSTSAARNADGSISGTTTRTRPDGSIGTVSRTYDPY